jgi:phosphoketolase
MTLVPPLTRDDVERVERLVASANYLTVGQIYLQENPLLKRSLSVRTSSLDCSAIGAPVPPELHLFHPTV